MSADLENIIAVVAALSGVIVFLLTVVATYRFARSKPSIQLKGDDFTIVIDPEDAKVLAKVMAEIKAREAARSSGVEHGPQPSGGSSKAGES